MTRQDQTCRGSLGRARASGRRRELSGSNVRLNLLQGQEKGLLRSDRRSFLGALSGLFVLLGCSPKEADLAGDGITLFLASDFTEPGSFTAGVEGPACDAAGNLYAVNFERDQTIGKVTPSGQATVFVELPGSSIGNGIRFDRHGNMLIADYVNHNVLMVDMASREVRVFAHEPRMNQPNDLAITASGILYVSDPNWQASTGQIWKIDEDGRVTLLEDGMGTTNGIEVSPNEKTLYVNESIQRKIWTYDILPDGVVANKRLLIQFPDFGMDGMRCDAAGRLFVTRYDKGTVAVVSAQGAVLREIPLTGRKPTNIAFGGPDGKTCYVTLADRGNIEVFRSDVPGRSWSLRHG